MEGVITKILVGTILGVYGYFHHKSRKDRKKLNKRLDDALGAEKVEKKP